MADPLGYDARTSRCAHGFERWRRKRPVVRVRPTRRYASRRKPISESTHGAINAYAKQSGGRARAVTSTRVRTVERLAFHAAGAIRVVHVDEHDPEILSFRARSARRSRVESTSSATTRPTPWYAFALHSRDRPSLAHFLALDALQEAGQEGEVKGKDRASASPVRTLSNGLSASWPAGPVLRSAVVRRSGGVVRAAIVRPRPINCVATLDLRRSSNGPAVRLHASPL